MAICTAWGYPGQRYPDCWTFGDEKPPTSPSPVPSEAKTDAQGQELPVYEMWANKSGPPKIPTASGMAAAWRSSSHDRRG